jgi:hypothetical protein
MQVASATSFHQCFCWNEYLADIKENLQTCYLPLDNQFTCLEAGAVIIQQDAIKSAHEFFQLFEDFTRLKALKFERVDDIALINDVLTKPFTNLKILSLVGSKISAFPDFINLYTIKILFIRDNKISMIAYEALRNLTNLKRVYLQNNEIIEIHPMAFQTQKSLKILNLENNRITRIKKTTFEGLESLQKLNLRTNKISVIDPEAFRSLKSLNELDLTSNFLDNLNLIMDSPIEVLRIWNHEEVRELGSVSINFSSIRDFSPGELVQSQEPNAPPSNSNLLVYVVAYLLVDLTLALVVAIHYASQ